MQSTSSVSDPDGQIPSLARKIKPRPKINALQPEISPELDVSSLHRQAPPLVSPSSPLQPSLKRRIRTIESPDLPLPNLPSLAHRTAKQPTDLEVYPSLERNTKSFITHSSRRSVSPDIPSLTRHVQKSTTSLGSNIQLPKDAALYGPRLGSGETSTDGGRGDAMITDGESKHDIYTNGDSDDPMNTVGESDHSNGSAGDANDEDEPDSISAVLDEANGVSIVEDEPDGASIVSEEADGVSVVSEEADGVSIVSEEADGVSIVSEEANGVSIVEDKPNGVSVVSKKADGISIVEDKPDGISAVPDEADGVAIVDYKPDGISAVQEKPDSVSFVQDNPDGVPTVHLSTVGDTAHPHRSVGNPVSSIFNDKDTYVPIQEDESDMVHSFYFNSITSSYFGSQLALSATEFANCVDDIIDTDAALPRTRRQMAAARPDFSINRMVREVRTCDADWFDGQERLQLPLTRFQGGNMEEVQCGNNESAPLSFVSLFINFIINAYFTFALVLLR